MSDSVFRLVYRKPRPGSVLKNFDITEVTFNGERLNDIARVTLDVECEGTPILKLERAKFKTSPIVDNLHIDGYAKVEIVTE